MKFVVGFKAKLDFCHLRACWLVTLFVADYCPSATPASKMYLTVNADNTSWSVLELKITRKTSCMNARGTPPTA